MRKRQGIALLLVTFVVLVGGCADSGDGRQTAQESDGAVAVEEAADEFVASVESAETAEEVEDAADEFVASVESAETAEEVEDAAEEYLDAVVEVTDECPFLSDADVQRILDMDAHYEGSLAYANGTEACMWILSDAGPLETLDVLIRDWTGDWELHYQISGHEMVADDPPTSYVEVPMSGGGQAWTTLINGRIEVLTVGPTSDMLPREQGRSIHNLVVEWVESNG